MDSPLDTQVIRLNTNFDKRASMPAEQFGRSIDSIPEDQSGVAPTGGGEGGAIVLPFQIVDITTGDTPAIYVQYGTVEDIEPTDIGAEIFLTPDDTNTVYLECALDADGFITGASVEVSTTGLPAEDWETAIKLIGTVITAGTGILTINQSLYFSQGFQACGRDPEDPETTPGDYQFFVT